MSKSYFNAIHSLIISGHQITDAISQQLKDYNIHEPQFNVLRILRGAKGTPLSVNTILERMVQRSSNITRIVDRLLQKQLVERTLSLTDRRKMDIVITPKGLELLIKLDQKVYEFHKPMMKKLKLSELNLLTQLINQLTGDVK